jgi:threonine/homoserine/homoserine lactone efflux protein
MKGETLQFNITLFPTGILIGLLFGIPVGAVGTLTIIRTLRYGAGTGLLTGLGSSVADCVYACISACGFSAISELLLKYKIIVFISGGCFLIYLGIHLWSKRRDNERYKEKKRDPKTKMQFFLSAFFIGITNPAAVFSFLFAFSYFGVGGRLEVPDGILLVTGVFLGTMCWWAALMVALKHLREKVKCYEMTIARICGTILILFGLRVMIRTII